MRGIYKWLQYHFRAAFIYCLSHFVRRKGVAEIAPEFNTCRVLFLCQNRIGDTLVATPVFRILKNHYPGMQLDVLLSRRNQEVLAHHPLITVRYIFKTRRLDVFAILKSIRKARYDFLVDFTVSRSTTSTLFSLLAGARLNVGLERENDFVYDFKYPPRLEKTVEYPRPRMSRTFAQVLHAFDIDPDKEVLHSEFFVRQDSRELAKANKEELLADGAQAVLGISIAASKPEKYWGSERYVSLIRNLCDSLPGYALMILYSPEYSAEANIIADKTPAVCSRPTNSLSDFAALIQSLDILVTPDSAAVHLADTAGIPVVVLTYESVSSELWHPSCCRYRVLSSDAKPLNNISVESVERSVQELVF